MGEHDALRVARRPRGVNHEAAVPGFSRRLPGLALVKEGGVAPASRKEVVPGVDLALAAFLVALIEIDAVVVVHDDRLDGFHAGHGVLVARVGAIAELQILVELLLPVDDDDLGLRVASDVCASVGSIRGVDASSDATGGDRTHIGEEPFRRVEPDDLSEREGEAEAERSVRRLAFLPRPSRCKCNSR